MLSSYPWGQMIQSISEVVFMAIFVWFIAIAVYIMLIVKVVAMVENWLSEWSYPW